MNLTNSTTYYQLILDASGSMSNVRIETLNAVNRQIEAIRELSEKNRDQEIRVSLMTFNTDTKTVFKHLDPRQVSLIAMRQYKTDGGTALLDALGMAIAETERIISENDDVVIVVLTDGEENASQYFSFKQIASRIRSLKKTERWTFSFLGADIDGWQIAKNLQIEKDEVRSFSKENLSDELFGASVRLSEYMGRKRQGIRDGFLKGPN
jgi:Mg-chelatase subunit ChlD